MAKVLITGGAGFIGSEITKVCLARGLHVRVFDLLPVRVPGAQEVLTGSILDPYEISLAARGCDYAIHAAAALGVHRTETNRLECLYINIQGTVNVLEAAVKEKVKKVLFTSSSEVYGDGNGTTLIHEESPLNPKSNYAITKLTGEEYLRAYQQYYGLDYSIVRFFSVYGANQVDQFVIPRFVNAVWQEQPPVIYGNGNQVRSFCHVEDAARGAVLALTGGAETSTQIFNIGNDAEPISMLELARKTVQLSGKALEPELVGFEHSDRTSSREIYWRVPDIAKARRILGYKPNVSLADGLRRMLAIKDPALAES